MLIPNLHLNQVTMVGQKKMSDYLAVKEDRDAFYAINVEKKKAQLYSWDILTGKLMSQFPLSADLKLAEYERFVS